MTSYSAAAVLAAEKAMSQSLESQRARSISLCPSTSTIDSTTKVTILDPAITQISWCADIESDLLNVEEFKIKSAQAKHWKTYKNELKKYVAYIRNDAVAKKFELDIKVIGR
jgi:hypothetical protein